MPSPKNLEKSESPAQNVPPPSERMERNNGAATRLERQKTPQTNYRKKLNDEIEERDNQFIRMDNYAQETVFKEANEGSQAWRDAMKKRNQETTSQRLKREKRDTPDDIDHLRNGYINGQPRQNTVADLQVASDIHPVAEEIRLDRAHREKKESKKKETKNPTPKREDRIADLGNEIDV